MFPQYTGGVRRARARTLVMMLALLFLMTSAQACRREGVESNSNSRESSSRTANDTSRTPPFNTKEPERYQWTSVTTVVTGNQETPAEAPVNTTTSQVFVARDGDLRREDYELSPGIKVSFLQLPSARYRLLHAQKMYAELGDEESAPGAPPPTAKRQNVPPDFSPDKLNAARTEARYEKLGAEELNGRTTTKYRVTFGGGAGEASNVAAAENLIWFDESLGVPVKTDTTGANGARYTMELRDIKLEVDASVFALPADYKRVDSKEIDTQMLSTYQLGGDANENDTKAQGK